MNFNQTQGRKSIFLKIIGYIFFLNQTAKFEKINGLRYLGFKILFKDEISETNKLILCIFSIN